MLSGIQCLGRYTVTALFWMFCLYLCSCAKNTAVLDSANSGQHPEELVIEVPNENNDDLTTEGSVDLEVVVPPETDDSEDTAPEEYLAQSLTTPDAFRMPVLGKSSDTSCSHFPTPYTGAMVFPSKYEGSDSSRDEINEDAEALYLELTESIKALEKNAAQWAGDYLMGDLIARDCALSMMQEWAVANALLGDANNMGQSVRKWSLSVLANVYLQLTRPLNAPPVPPAQKELIESWFLKMAEDAVVYYSDRPLDKVNNHDYWAAWAVMAVSVIVNRQDLFDWSKAKLEEGIGQITESGYLPNELRRETRALSYHNYAMQPLTWLAVFTEANGAELSESQQLALYRLAQRTVEGLQRPDAFQELTGYEQYIDGVITSYNLAWLEIWVSHFDAMQGMDTLLSSNRPMKSTRLGGNVSILFSAVSGRSEKPFPKLRLSSD